MENNKQIKLDITGFDPEKEKIGRQYNATASGRSMYSRLRQEKIAQEIENRERVFMDKGAEGLVKEGDQWLAAQIYGMFKYSAANMLYHDLGYGLYTALTDQTGQTVFYDMEPVYNGNGTRIATRVVLSLSGAYKLALGAAVNKKGYAIRGAGNVVDRQKGQLKSILYANVPAPFALMTINKTDPRTGVKNNIAMKAHPIVILASTKDAFVIQIEHSFFPIKEVNGKIVASEKYLHTPAGLYTLCSLGSYLLKNKFPELAVKDSAIPKGKAITMLMLALQGAHEMRTLVPEICTSQGKYILRGQSLFKQIYPSVFRGDGTIEYRKAIDFIRNAGIAQLLAIRHTGIAERLNENVLIPATSGSSFFLPTGKGQPVQIKLSPLADALKGAYGYPSRQVSSLQNRTKKTGV